MEKKEENKQETKSDGLKFNDNIKTTTNKFRDIVKLKLEQLKDLATLEVLLPIEARLRERMKSLQTLSKAQSIKIRGHWKTIAPNMHTRNLKARKLSNDEGEITFEVYEIDEKNNKKLYEHKTEVELHDGSKIKRTTSAEYRIAYEVTELIKRNKPITREIIQLGSD